jgi:glycosyltransferase involved in cell wall biosynthesis
LQRFRPDICHFTNGVAPLRMEFPYVLSVHDLSLIRHPEWHPRSRRLWMRRILRPSALRAAGILCDSEAARKDVLAWIQVEPSCVRVVPLAARRSFLRRCSDQEKSAVRKKYGLQNKFFLYVGNLEPRKNLSLLMRAFKEADLADFDLVLAGRRAWLWKDVLLEIGRERMESKIKLLDYVPEGDLAALYQCASVFVYPSRMEGFGLPLVEAMTSETPVVTSRVEPLVSLAGDAAWLAHPDDEQEWREALKEAASSEKERVSRARRAKQLAAQYSWERAARETLRFYEAALSRTNSCIR